MNMNSYVDLLHSQKKSTDIKGIAIALYNYNPPDSCDEEYYLPLQLGDYFFVLIPQAELQG